MCAHDFIFTAMMLGFKETLQNCFNNEPVTFGQAVRNVTASMPHGVFTNTIILEITQRVGIPLDRVINFILPGPNRRFPSLADNIKKLESRYDMLNQPRQARFTSSLQRIMPLIRSNGVLFLIEKLIDQQYAGQIKLFLEDLVRESDAVGKSVTSVIIDGIKIKQQYLV